MSTESLLLGLDVGTQSLRAALVDLNGRTVAFGVAPIETTYPHPSWAEQNPANWWSAAQSAVAQALQSAGVSPSQIAGIGLDCTACTVVACNRDGLPLRPALLWMDQRAGKEADEIAATGDPALRYVSGRPSPEWMLPKALWLKRNEPEVFDRADYIIECTDWFMHQLTGEWTLSLNHCAVKWNYARPDGGWPRKLLGQIGLDGILDKWPERIVPLGQGGESLSQQAASALGLRPGIPVAQGGIDAYLGMIGLGATRPGDVAIILGSSTCYLAQSSTGVFGSGWAGCCPDATIEGQYTLEAGQTATGSILDWYRRHFAGREAAESAKLGQSVYQILDDQARAVPAGAEGLVIREDWQGNRSPHKNPHARGAIVGLTLAHGPGHIVRALYEAMACGARRIMEDGTVHGLKVDRLIAGGGGVRSALWLQIMADVLQQPIHLTAEPESCALGSAIAAGIAAGFFRDFPSAAETLVRPDRTVEPNHQHRDIYNDLYARHTRLYDAVSNI